MNSLAADRFLFQINSRHWKLLALFVLAAGILLRLAFWWQQRPILLDEANLIRNYVERDYGGLFQDLDYEQYAPPFFSIMVKASIGLFGNNELSTRLFPVLCSIGALVLFYRLSSRFLKLPAATAALAFVAFGPLYLDYATQCKQYATDGFITLLLLDLTFRFKAPPGFNRRTLFWIFTGALAVWFSMPAVFMLAGIGLYWLAQAWQVKSKSILLGTVLAGCCWLISFAVYFKLLLLHNAQSDYLQNYHREFFLAFPPTGPEELALLGEQLERIGKYAIGKTAIAKFLTVVALLAAIREIFKKRQEPQARAGFWLLVMPILFCLAASALGFYSVLARLTLFFLPLLVLLVFLGLESLATNRGAAMVTVTVVLVVLANQQQLTAGHKPFHSDFPEVREALHFIAREQQPGEVLIASDDVLPVVRYYTQHHQGPIPVKNADLKKLGYGKAADLKLDSLRQLGHQRVWVVASIHDQAFEALASQPERILQRKNYFYAFALLFKL